MPTIDDVKKFWDERPCNVRHSDHTIGTLSYFDQVAQRKFLAEPHILSFIDFPAWNNKRVLEIGCGIGTIGANFIKHGARYTGVDISETTIAIARKAMNVYGLDADLYQGNAEMLDQFLPKNKFDLIYAWGVLHHTPYPELILEQTKKYLIPNGTLKIMVYAKTSWKNFMIQAGLDQPEAQWGCPIANTYDKDEIVSMLDKDFEIRKIDQDHIFPYDIESYKKKEYVLQPWFRCMPKEMFHVLERNLGWHIMVTARLKSVL